MSWPFVRVDWVDACSNNGWHAPDKPCDLARIVTFGYVIHEDDERLVVAGSVDTSLDAISESIAIPAGCVKSVITLEGPEFEPVLNVET